MCEVNHQRHSRPLALFTMLAFTVSVVGCAAETEKPAVVEKEPPQDVVEESATLVTPTTPAEPAAPAKPMPSDAPVFWQNIAELGEYHGYEDGIRWRLGAKGIELKDATIEGHKVSSAVIEKVWSDYGAIIGKWSAHYEVPIEVILTAVCVESKGNPRAKGGRNIGLMQLLLPTAQSALKDPSITEESLYDPNINIQAGTAYIALQSRSTKYDPPKVAAAYNAGSLRSSENRWGMKQYGPHLDKTVVWFNAVLAFMASEEKAPQMSFAGYFKNRP